MFDVVAPLNTEGDTAERIAAEEAAGNASAPLVSGALVLQLGPLLSVCLAVRALEEHRRSLAVEARQPYELPLLLCNEELCKLASLLLLVALACRVRINRLYQLPRLECGCCIALLYCYLRL